MVTYVPTFHLSLTGANSLPYCHDSVGKFLICAQTKAVSSEETCLEIEFANNESSAAGAPPRMKIVCPPPIFRGMSKAQEIRGSGPTTIYYGR